ncbi:MAG: hypothetical protein F4X81_00890 [Gammaproteobacteria bacterium]|nr:hypothetical protein [Gammaproteobacteria bacterium]MYE50004.1 hypothetical protein [Gammaproteobacteria bacterium]MYH17143.1 hypothetical protein [Gammaproteobacteria bacterium]MYK81052.1 hypothetical protein [Gammaproteobacteria bacterium]
MSESDPNVASPSPAIDTSKIVAEAVEALHIAYVKGIRANYDEALSLARKRFKRDVGVGVGATPE